MMKSYGASGYEHMDSCVYKQLKERHPDRIKWVAQVDQSTTGDWQGWLDLSLVV